MNTNVDLKNETPTFGNTVLPAVKLCVGQKLWLVRSHHYRGDNREPIEVTISKVGKKYFELEDYHRCKFEIETLKQVTETNYVDRCHLTLQEILDEREADKLAGQIKNIFGGYGKPKLTLEQLRKIMDVVGGKI
jgi:hypothetical protein